MILLLNSIRLPQLAVHFAIIDVVVCVVILVVVMIFYSIGLPQLAVQFAIIDVVVLVVVMIFYSI